MPGPEPQALIEQVSTDLLRELDRMEFYVYETHQTVVARHRPIIVITSNNEKELPDAFLRRCFFHYIKFPEIAERVIEGLSLAGLDID